MIIGVPAETVNDERRVAIVPGVLAELKKLGLDVLIQSDAGVRAGFPDVGYRDKGATITSDRHELFSKAEIIAHIQPPSGDLSEYREKQIVIGALNPLGAPDQIQQLAEKQLTVFALELLPRITRAQGMDILSSMASIAGYKAVLLAANHLDKQFPLMMTAAGTITPARVFIVGAGVAGLQAIATAKRLGAVVQAYDVRPVVKEQVESLGAKFLELELSTTDAEGKGGYAKAMGDEFYQKQREAMTHAVAESDVVITTAAIPGKKAPVLITETMVHGMRPGSVLIDLAAETGGNCELTKAGETQNVNGVSIVGPVNLPASLPLDASQMFAKNITAFLKVLIKDGAVQLNLEDEIIRDTLVANEGKITNSRVQEALEQA